MKNKNLFSENKVTKSSLKYFIISFSVFIVILAVCSVVLLMDSLDYDVNNILGENTTTTTTAESNESETKQYSVNDLNGKSNLLFIIEDDEHSLDFVFTVFTDFDNKSMVVKSYESNSKLTFDGKNYFIENIYSTHYENGLKSAFNNEGIVIDKYVILTSNQLEDVLGLFDGFSINVQNPVDYKSSDFNLKLDKGMQELSPDLAYKYLIISDNSTCEQIICDIISSVLVPEYADKSDKLFTSFVNLCETDISVIDYSEIKDTITAYSCASDKFLPRTESEVQE